MTADPEFNAAIRIICDKTFPKGFDWSPDAPNTFEDLFRHRRDGGRSGTPRPRH